jgi:TonB family protein
MRFNRLNSSHWRISAIVSARILLCFKGSTKTEGRSHHHQGKSGMRRLSGLAALLAIISTGADAQPAADSEPGQWIINASEHFCSLTRTTRDPVPITFSLRVVPGVGTAELLIISPQWQSPPLRNLEEVQLVTDPAATEFTAEPRAGRLPNHEPIVAFRELPTPFIDAFAQASSVRISRNGETRISFSFRQADRAVAALRECVRYTLEDWGIDQAGLDALRESPTLLRHWIDADDYPIPELRAGLDGGVTIGLSIDAEGRITGCRVLASSGHAGFDRNTCEAARNSGAGHYRPAINGEGQPVAAEIVQRIRFQVVL